MTNYPSEFTIANTPYSIEFVDTLEGGEYAIHSDVKREIKVARSIKTLEDGVIDLTEGQIENSYWHEVFHAFNFFYNNEQDEALAQTFANFMCEYLHSKR